MKKFLCVGLGVSVLFSGVSLSAKAIEPQVAQSEVASADEQKEAKLNNEKDNSKEVALASGQQEAKTNNDKDTLKKIEAKDKKDKEQRHIRHLRGLRRVSICSLDSLLWAGLGTRFFADYLSPLTYRRPLVFSLILVLGMLGDYAKGYLDAAV